MQKRSYNKKDSKQIEKKQKKYNLNNNNLDVINSKDKVVQTKNVSNQELENNKIESKRKMTIRYVIPLIILIIVAVIYIPTQKNVLLIPFAIFTMIVLFGWDASTRTCPKCKKWNSVSWIKTENIKRKTTKSKKNFIGKEKEIKKVLHIRKIYKKCRNCGHEFETEQNKLF